MTVAGFAVAVFSLAIVLHVLFWQIRVPRRQSVALLVILFGTFPIALGIAWSIPDLSRFAPVGLWPTLHVFLFHTAFSLGYIVTYSALAEDSPTLSILVYVSNAGPAGRSEAELLRLVSNEMIVGPRFDGLVSGGIIEPVATDATRFVLTAKGMRWAKFFAAFRSLYRLRKGG